MKRIQDSDRTSRVCSARILAALFFILFACGFCTLCDTLAAAPVTLQFDAVVGPPLLNFDGPLPPSWNLSLHQGDIISGEFTFNPFDAPSNTSITRLIQPYDFSFHIKTEMLTTSQYGLEVYNNSGAVDDEGINPSDDIYIGCSAGINTPSCIPAVLATPDLLMWSFRMSLGGSPSVLDGADIPSDPMKWQQISSETSLVVIFIDNNLLRSYGFRASPTLFRAVPEPACGVWFVLQIVAILFAQRVRISGLSMISHRR